MIRIEPEHLGPARLNLSLHNDQLTARVIVESPAAKVAVENSLDQLTQQLSRVGIELDRLEVALSGGNTPQQFLSRRPRWSFGGKLPAMDSDKDDSIPQVTPSQIIPPSAAGIAGAGGVNLLV